MCRRKEYEGDENRCQKLDINFILIPKRETKRSASESDSAMMNAYRVEPAFY